MSMRDCWDAVEKAMKRPPTMEEFEGIAEAVQARRRSNLNKGMTPREAAREAGKTLTEEAKLAKSLKNREAYNNILIFADRMAEQDLKNPVVSERALLAGTSIGSARGAADGIDANHHSLTLSTMAPVLRKLKEEGLLDAVNKNDKAFNQDVARALHRRDDPTLGPDTGNTHAKRVAEILGDALEVTRAMQNKAGAFIGKLDGYMGRQYHDVMKVRGKGKHGNFQAWRDYIVPRLDREATAPGLSDAQFEAQIQDAWQGLAFGIHDGKKNPVLSGFQGSPNLAKKVSQGRTLIFKDADSWFEYNETFGKGTVMDAVWAAADRAALATAVMQKLGNNPEHMFKRIHEANLERAKANNSPADIRDKLLSNPNEKLLDVVLGNTSIPGNANMAHYFATARNVMQIVHLGRVVFSMVTDPINTSAVLRANGIPLWEGLSGQIRAILPHGPRAKEIAHSVGAAVEAGLNHRLSRFRSEDGLPGAMTNMVHTMHKLNLMIPLTNNQEIGMATALTASMGFHAKTDFAALPPRMQVSLRRYGIEGAEWDIGRSSAAEANGRMHLLPAEVGDEAVRQKFFTYVTDQIREGLSHPTASSRRITTGGLQAGTWEGEIFRSFFQFKSFTITHMQRHWGRVLYRGEKTDFPGMIYLAVGATLAGFVGNTLSDFALGKSMRQPEDGYGWGSVAQDAMMRGGAMGILGDVILRDSSSAEGMAKGLLGPLIAGVVFPTAYAVKATYDKLTDGKYSSKSTGDVAQKQIFDLIKSNTPNLFYVAAVVNYLFGVALTEIFDPGARRRAEKYAKEKDQHFMW